MCIASHNNTQPTHTIHTYRPYSKLYTRARTQDVYIQCVWRNEELDVYAKTSIFTTVNAYTLTEQSVVHWNRQLYPTKWDRDRNTRAQLTERMDTNNITRNWEIIRKTRPTTNGLVYVKLLLLLLFSAVAVLCIFFPIIDWLTDRLTTKSMSETRAKLKRMWLS